MNAEIGTKTKPGIAAGGAAAAASPAVLHFADFDINVERGELLVRGSVTALRPKSFALLVYLARRPGRLLSKDELIEAVWPDVVVSDDSLVQCISELRAAFEDSSQQVIKTVPRRGYLLDARCIDASLVSEGAGAREHASRSGLVPSLTMRSRSLPWLVALGAACTVVIAGALWFGIPNRAQTRSLMSKNTITILPLAGVGGENAGELAEAIGEDLTIEISRLPDTLVIGAPVGYSHLAGDALQLGRRLDVAYVLSGSVLRRGEAVSIALKLQASADDVLLWSGRFDYAEQAGWNWRQDVSARIANELKVRIDEAETPLDKPYAGRSFAAIDPTLQGWRLLKRIHTRDVPQRARALFEQSLQIDPASASALAGLALSHVTEVLNRWSTAPDSQTALAAQAIERSLALQPNDARANYIRSLVLSVQGRIDDAEHAVQRALALHPNQPRALQRLGFLRLQQGRPEAVAGPVMLSLRLDPLNSEQVSLGYFTLGMAEFHLHHDDLAYAHMRQAAISSPQNGFAWQWLAAMDALHGRSEQAKANLVEYQKRIPGHTVGGLKASEYSRDPTFWLERNRFYEGLRLAGLPE
ncbi:winged helix-turn-helix domain-containing protein [Bradyrhizobium cosmicum]|uniref:winged helix-turn-helix domain-containing protein n=1 Tax=Bradyrhizobium cosmicum TaxID=1404864 RepID=UPI0028EBF6E7|nr:winged helix-turn-helix domain-containing protein [Bradyrhizobium cosmicum]